MEPRNVHLLSTAQDGPMAEYSPVGRASLHRSHAPGQWGEGPRQAGQPQEVDNDPLTSLLPLECGGHGFCMRQTNRDRSENLAFVGNGRGRYRQETQYKYVGEGKGEFMLVPQANGSALQTHLPAICYCAALGLLGALLGLGLWPLFNSSYNKEREGSRSMAVEDGRYSCEPGDSDWESSWSFSQKEYCCKKLSFGCPSSAKAKSTFSCKDDGSPSRRRHWSTEQQDWCCANEQIGCPSPKGTTPMHFDCHQGLDKWWVQWPVQKQVWCCVNSHLGCPTQSPHARVATTSAPFDCDAALNNWEAAWSEHKKVWCCNHAGKGCRPLSDDSPCDQDCSYNGKSGSCRQRFLFVAELRFAGQPGACSSAREAVMSVCPGCEACHVDDSGCRDPTAGMASTTALRRFDCLAGFAMWEKAWNDDKKAWCCKHEKKGCVLAAASSTTTTEPYQCMQHPMDGLANWEVDWSLKKQEWCCQHKGKGCTSTSTTGKSSSTGSRTGSSSTSSAATSSSSTSPSSSTTTARSTSSSSSTTARPTTTSTEVKTTSTEAGTTSTIGFNCLADLLTWEHSWPTAKKQWCCAHMSRGCPYDCSTAFSTWKTSWDERKKRWCCQHEKRGCEEPPDLPEGVEEDAKKKERDADSTVPEDEHKSSALHHRAVPSSTTVEQQHDCSDGFSTWHKSWSESKQAWCCNHHQRGCPSAVASSLPFDCLAGFDHWEAGWSVGKKRWCCRNRGRGCPSRAHR